MMFRVTYHFISGDKKIILYENSDNMEKEKFINDMFRWQNGSFVFYSDEKIKNIVNINHVCYIEVEEVQKEITAEEIVDKVFKSNKEVKENEIK